VDKLGVSYHRLKDWVKKGYVHVRRVGRRGNLVIWADAEERDRLGRLGDYPRPGRSNRYPDEPSGGNRGPRCGEAAGHPASSSAQAADGAGSRRPEILGTAR
jgi:hypothetical protein